MSPISRLAGRLRSLALACAAVGAAAEGVRAEEPATSNPAATEDITVVAPRRRRTEATQDPTASATVVEADRFAGESKGVAELVATAPGVAVNDYGGLGQLSTVSIRGSTSSGVLVLLDGLPLNTAAGGGVDLSTIPRAWISRIEIARGTEGAAYGVGALGGVVNVVTARPEPGAWSAEASGGSFGTFSANADRAAGDERWSVLAQAEVDGSEGDFPYDRTLVGQTIHEVRTNNGALRGGALVKVAGQLGDKRLDVLAQLTAGQRDLAGWPQTSHVDWQRDARALAMARLAVPAGAGLVLAGRAHVRGDLLDISLEDVSAGRVTRQRDTTAGAAGEAVWAHRAGELRAALSAEGEALSSDAVDGTHARSSLSAAVSDDLSLGGGTLRIAPAVRADRVGPFAGLSAKLGASARLSGPIAVRASAGTSFRPPSFAELYMQQGLVMPNPELRSEEGIGADAGVVMDGRLGLATFGGYATVYRDLIEYEATAFGRLLPRNTGKALVEGLEAEAASAPLAVAAGLAVSGSYTLLVTENLRGSPEEVGKELPFRPRHRLYARAAIAPGRFGAHVEAHWVSAQFQDARNAVAPVPAALVWNAGASVRALTRPEVSLNLEIRNLLDDRTLQEPYGGPLPGRTVMLTVRAGPPPAKGSPPP